MQDTKHVNSIFFYIIYLFLIATEIYMRKLVIILSKIFPASVIFFLLSRLTLASSSALKLHQDPVNPDEVEPSKEIKMMVGSRKGSSPSTSSLSSLDEVKVGARTLKQNFPSFSFQITSFQLCCLDIEFRLGWWWL